VRSVPGVLAVVAVGSLASRSVANTECNDESAEQEKRGEELAKDCL